MTQEARSFQDLDTDVDSAIPAAIKEKSAWWRHFPQTDRHWVRINRIYNLVFESPGLVYGPIETLEPTSVKRDVIRYLNCTGSQQSVTSEYQRQASSSVDVTIAQGLKSTTQIKASVGTGKALPVNIAFDAIRTQEVSFLRTERNSFTTSDSERKTIPLNVPAWTLMRGEVLTTRGRADLPFTADVVAEADIEFEWNNDDGSSGGYRHNIIQRKLSWAIPNANDRKFPVSGVIHGGSFHETDAKLLSRPLNKNDRQDCPLPFILNADGERSGQADQDELLPSR